MKGLFWNDLYGAQANLRVFGVVMALLGVFVVALDDRIPALIIGYALLGMVGFSLNALAGLGKEGAAKWARYKLAAPVRRADIVGSAFLSLLLWLLVGAAVAGVVIFLSVTLHGFSFDRDTDLFMLFVVGTGVSLFMGAVFLPLLYLGGEGRREALLVVSLLSAVGIVLGLTTLINTLFPHMTTFQLILGGLAILLCALAAFGLSFPLTVAIFRRREY